MSSSADAVRAFQNKHRGEDAESTAVLAELTRLFPELAKGNLPRDEDDEDDIGEVLEDLDADVEEGALSGAPAALRTMTTFLVFEDYVKVGGREISLFGVADFEDANGEDGILGSMKAAGDAPEGVFQIGQDLFVDSRGELAPEKPGAIVTAIWHALEDAKELAPSLSAFLATAR